MIASVVYYHIIKTVGLYIMYSHIRYQMERSGYAQLDIISSTEETSPVS